MSQRHRRSGNELLIPDPTGEFHGGMPTYGWGRAPKGLSTRRQLRAAGRSIGGQQAVAQVVYGRYQFAWLYEAARSRPRRRPSAAQLAAVGKALAARRWCPTCERDVGYCISTRYGECVDCLTGTAPADASTDPRTVDTALAGTGPWGRYRDRRYPRAVPGTADQPVPDEDDPTRYPADRYRMTTPEQNRRAS